MASTFAGDLASILGQDEAGEDATLRTFVTEFNPATGLNEETETDTPVRAHFGSFTVEERAGGLVQDGDTRALIAADGLAEPDGSAQVIDGDGAIWSVRTVVKRRAAGSYLSYVLAVHQ